jgi:hypothetical protein
VAVSRDSAAPTGAATTADSGAVPGAGGTATPPTPPGGAPNADPPPISADSARRLEDPRRRADSARRALSAPAAVQLEGTLPPGWTWTVNGRRGPSSLTARLRPGRPNTVTFEAPGYCPETLQIESPAPGSTQRWTPRLTGKPMVGEC